MTELQTGRIMLPFPVILGEQVWVFVALKMGKIEGDTETKSWSYIVEDFQKQGTEAKNLDHEARILGWISPCKNLPHSV